MITKWKKVKGFGGRYIVSNYGEVKSVEKDILQSNGRSRRFYGKTIKKTLSNSGYYRVYMCNKGRDKFKSVHRIVAQEFICNPKNLPCVNHKNGVKTDNMVKNLEWCTYSENIQHSFLHGMSKGRGGVLNGKAKLDKMTVRVIAHLKNISKMPQWKIGKIFKTDQSTISLIWNKKQWSSVTKNII